jgi:hypothetical protein
MGLLAVSWDGIVGCFMGLLAVSWHCWLFHGIVGCFMALLGVDFSFILQ